jgi:hypothetical protein
MVLPQGVVASSDVQSVLKRTPISIRRPAAKAKSEGVDFERARTANQLGNSFKSYFEPSTEIDDSPEEGFVFE